MRTLYPISQSSPPSCLQLCFKMRTVLLLLCALVSLSSADIWQKCSGFSGNVALDKVEVEGCSALPCVLNKGTNVTITISFKPSVSEKTVSNKVQGIIGHIPIKFPLDQADACALGVSCPMAPGTEVVEKVTLTVSKVYPSITAKVRWQLLDEDGKEQACFETAVQIK